MLMDDANALADKLRDSDEYKTYCETKARAYENPSTAALLALCKTLRRTDWISNFAPPELGDALFDRPPNAPRGRCATARRSS